MYELCELQCNYPLLFGNFLKQKTAYEIIRGLVGSEMCIRDRNDILEVLNIARHHTLPGNRVRLRTFQKQFTVDDITEVIDPKGLSCETLKVDMLTIHGKKSVVENFQKLVSDIPINLSLIHI